MFFLFVTVHNYLSHHTLKYKRIIKQPINVCIKVDRSIFNFNLLMNLMYVFIYLNCIQETGKPLFNLNKGHPHTA